MDNNFLDDPDIYEQILRYLIRSDVIYNYAKDIEFQPEDLESSDVGTSVYSQFYRIALEINQPPTPKDMFFIHLKNKYDNKEFGTTDIEEIAKLVTWVYSDEELRPEYVKTILPMFIRRRRMLKLQQTHSDDIEELQKELNKLVISLERTTASDESIIINPFAALVTKELFAGVPIGITKVDAATGGLQFTNSVLTMGFSSCGKTALSSMICRNIALAGYKTVFCSAEEDGKNITQRVYAQTFKINYKDLYAGKRTLELREAFENMDAAQRKVLTENFRIIDMRRDAPLNIRRIQCKLEELMDEGFEPDFVVFDQLDYLEPLEKIGAGGQKWNKQEAASFDCNTLSNVLLRDRKPFIFWVNHQATGEIKKKFTRQQIEGYKNVIKPFDWAFGIGRESLDSNNFCFFSLKVRHSEAFETDLIGDLKYMSFDEVNVNVPNNVTNPAIMQNNFLNIQPPTITLQ